MSFPVARAGRSGVAVAGNSSDIVIRVSRGRRPLIRTPGSVRIRMSVGNSSIEREYRVECKTPAAVEYLRERLRGLMEELDGVRVE